MRHSIIVFKCKLYDPCISGSVERSRIVYKKMAPLAIRYKCYSPHYQGVVSMNNLHKYETLGVLWL